MSDKSGLKVTQLTPDHRAQIAVYADKWLAIGLSTASTDHQAAEAAADAAYRLAGLPTPPIKIWLASPLQGMIGAYLVRRRLSRHWNQDWHYVRTQVWEQVWHQVEEQVREQLRAEAQSQAWDAVLKQVGPWVGKQVQDRVRQQVAQQIGEALDVALATADGLAKVDALHEVAAAYAEAGQPDRAAAIFQRTWRIVQAVPDPSVREARLSWLTWRCLDAGLEELAREVGAGPGSPVERG
jgi:hypothetical protein